MKCSRYAEQSVDPRDHLQELNGTPPITKLSCGPMEFTREKRKAPARQEPFNQAIPPEFDTGNTFDCGNARTPKTGKLKSARQFAVEQEQRPPKAKRNRELQSNTKVKCLPSRHELLPRLARMVDSLFPTCRPNHGRSPLMVEAAHCRPRPRSGSPRTVFGSEPQPTND